MTDVPKATNEETQEEEVFSRLIYLERESRFSEPRGIIELEDHKKVVKFSHLQRAMAVISGTMLAFDPTTSQGRITIASNSFTCEDTRPVKTRKRSTQLGDLIGKLAHFSFLCASDFRSTEKTAKESAIKHFPISFVHKQEFSSPGYVEVVGKLEEVWPGGFVISIWRKWKQSFRYITFVGEYPAPDETGNFLWVIGNFDPQKGTIRFVEREVIQPVPDEQTQHILQLQQEQHADTKGSRKKRKKRKRK